ncbi:MAG: saccharopine dehydrogenase C-terminal domain-containing protein [Crocinitomicaceae bacterium]|mgnify:FL=1|jgi:saccharopine dehydrogenase (NAD+, L-glutamate forming)|tara:strand:+ start:1662 stop:3011 length:1350 start_codon:yes stop_codon:yes gene_type:complete
MKTILILGAGLSASSMIRYLLNSSKEEGWQLRVVDRELSRVEKLIAGYSNAQALSFNATERDERMSEMEKADLVISMLPARFHVEIARDCIALKKNLITPSYISEEMRELDTEAKAAGIVIMNEIGVDPGLDHMSAMKIIDQIKEIGGSLNSFKSFCGGLVAQDYDDNPWRYKFTWNPRNVVLAGKGGTAMFLDNHEFKYIPYNRLFDRLDRIIIPGHGKFVGYPNRDSLSYKETYGLNGIATLYRGTLRRPNFCKGFNVFIELGMTDDAFPMNNAENLRPRDFLNAFLPFIPNLSVEQKFKYFLREDRMYLYDQFEWLGVFDADTDFGFKDATPAQLLEKLMVRKMSLSEDDKDMLVMYHEFEYSHEGKSKKIVSSMINIGEDQTYTAMANTVGLPLAISAKMILNADINTKGVTLPIQKEIYEPILAELSEYGIVFNEQELEIEENV